MLNYYRQGAATRSNATCVDFTIGVISLKLRAAELKENESKDFTL